MSFFTQRSPVSKKPWKRSFDVIDVDNGYPKFQPNFKLPKVDGFRKFPERCAFRSGIDESARHFTDTKARRRSTASHVAIIPFKPPNYGSWNYRAPRNKFNDSEQRLAFKAKLNNVAATRVPSKHGSVSGKLKSSCQQPLSCGWERQASKNQEEISFPREISLQKVVSQKSWMEPRPSLGTDHDSFTENEAQIRAMAGLKVPKNVLQENALKSPANYKGDAFREFSDCHHAFDPVISEIKSQGSNDAETYRSSGIATNVTTVMTKSDVSKNLNFKPRKVDDSERKMTSEAKRDGVAENGIWLTQVSVLDTLRNSSQPLPSGTEWLPLKTQEDISSSLIYAPQSGVCVKQKFNVEQKPAIAVSSHAHSIENGTHVRDMTWTKALKNVMRENSLKCHAYSGYLVNQKSDAKPTSKNTVYGHDRFIENTAEVKRTTGSNVLKITSEENSSKCQKEPSSVLNTEACKKVHVKKFHVKKFHLENTFGSILQAEEDKVSFSSLGEYGARKPYLKPLDLRREHDEKMLTSPAGNRKSKIAEEMDAVDLEFSFVDNATAEKPSREVTDCDIIPGNCGYKEQQVKFQHLFGDKIVVVNMQGEARVSEQTFNNDEHHFFYYAADHGVADDHIQKLKQLKDCIVLISDRYHVHDSRKSVKQALNLFKDVYIVRMQAYKAEQNHGNAIQKIDVRTAMVLRHEQKWVNCQRIFVGHVPGVEIGDQFRLRAELAIVGLHRTFVSGIDYVKIQGKNYAISIVDSGRYENQSRSPNSFIYVGHGGNPKIAGKEPVDQKLICGNLALKNSRDKGVPVRVICGRHMLHENSNSYTLGISNKTYIYEGLFVVTRFWQERVQHGKMAFMFELHRMSNQPSLTQQMPLRPKKLGRWYPRQVLIKRRKFWKAIHTCDVFKNSLKKSTMSHQILERVVVDDVSQGKENLLVRVVSDIYAERPPPFTYTANMIYPDWYHPSIPLGCDCTNGCSDSRHCFCAVRNGGEIPFNSQGAIIKPKPVIYECGPSCKCPPSCRNRVSQRGLRYHLEIFRKKSRGWGVRSRDYISSGSFVCEFVGELVDEKEAGKRIGHSEYVFHIGIFEKDTSKGKTMNTDSFSAGAHLAESSSSQRTDDKGFKIDAARWGNVARFINCGFSPNLYVQNVLYDDDYKSVPHVMLFASKNIPPRQELTCHYNDRYLSDANSKIMNRGCGSC